MTAPRGISLRRAPRRADAAAVADLVAGTGFFSDEEVGIARELVESALASGHASGYEFVLADAAAGLAGYACFGRIPGTEASFDLYWVVVAPSLQGQGVGRRLLGETESAVRSMGGTRLYIDTSSRPQYGPTRQFYAACGYSVAAELPDFYRPGDGKVIFVKPLGGGWAVSPRAPGVPAALG